MNTDLLHDIALFVEVAKTRSFSRAAAHLAMPASTLSRRIGLLEQSIGLRLFNRTTRKVEVTEAGQAYYARCAHLVEEARLAHEDIAATVTQVQGTLRLSCASDFATVYLPDILAAYAQKYPAIQVDLDLSSRFADLVSEGLDAALRIGRLADSSLVATRVGSLHLGLYASPAYLRHAPALHHPQDLANHTCIRLGTTAASSRWRLHRHNDALEPEQDVEPQEVSVSGRFAVSSVSMTRALALLGAGIGLIDMRLVSTAVTQGQLVRVLPQWCLAPAPLHLLTPSRLVPARVRLFRDMLVERFRAAGGWQAQED